MSVEVVLLVATAVLAVVAVAAAIVAVRATRRAPAAEPEPESAPEALAPSTEVAVTEPAPVVDAPVRVVEGRVVATPTQQQVVDTAMGRPAVRLAVLAAGLEHALRPESRDRIVALVRREYRQRRRVRRRAARRAARVADVEELRREDSWLGTQPAAPIDLAARRERQHGPGAVGE